MRLRQIFFAVAFITPFLTLPIEGNFFNSNGSEKLSPEINADWVAGKEWIDWRNGLSYSTGEFNGTVWMTENFKNLSTLMTYEEALSAAPEGWRLPTEKEWDNLLKVTGFDSNPNDIIPSAYYSFSFQSDGINDPLLGLSQVNETGAYWMESAQGDRQGNYVAIPNRELKYKHTITLKSAKMAVRYVKR